MSPRGGGPLQDALDTLVKADWDDVHGLGHLTEPLLRSIVEDGDLPRAFEHVHSDPLLRAACEHDWFFRKICLARDTETGTAIRLHMLAPEDTPVPHNHRASFAALMLAGGYDHLQYDIPGEWLNPGPDDRPTAAQIRAVRPTTGRTERPGSFYVLHHTGVHATLVDEGHISLVARGPSRRRRLLMMYPDRGEIEWLYGSVDEDDDALRAKQMTDSVLEEAAQTVLQLTDQRVGSL